MALFNCLFLSLSASPYFSLRIDEDCVYRWDITFLIRTVAYSDSCAAIRFMISSAYASENTKPIAFEFWWRENGYSMYIKLTCTPNIKHCDSLLSLVSKTGCKWSLSVWLQCNCFRFALARLLWTFISWIDTRNTLNVMFLHNLNCIQFMLSFSSFSRSHCVSALVDLCSNRLSSAQCLQYEC